MAGRLISKKLCYFCLCLFFLLQATTIEGSSWGYVTGDILPAQWPTADSAWFCGGGSQSPIDFQNAVHGSYLMPVNYTVTPQWMAAQDTLANDGHKVILTFGHQIQYSVRAGDCWRVLHVHWHWGSSDDRGSEHTVRGKMYPIEAHIVSWNCAAYTTAADAVRGASGLSVLGIFYEIVPDGQKNSILENITMEFPNVMKAPAYHNAVSKSIPSVDFMNLFPQNKARYWRYSGSLTTPNCSENVLWTVLKEKAPITATQLGRFRALKYPNDSPMVNNYRPVQPLNPTTGVSYRLVMTAHAGRATQPMSAFLLLAIFIGCGYRLL